MACSICTHEKRREIEQRILYGNEGSVNESLKAVSDDYELDIRDLQVHIMMHSKMDLLEDASAISTIASEVKKKEADILLNAAIDYQSTMFLIGREIRGIVSSEGNSGLAKIAKQTVDLYLGTGDNLRKTIESLVDINVKVNGEQDSGVQALADIVNAIRGSKND